jgi:large subunit ribosomal protein L15
MKELSRLKPPEGAVRKKKRVGRGPGSNWGKTAGRGHKGQKSRSGGTIPPYFEGGQMPLYRRLPKRGFTNVWAKTIAWVNVHQLNRFDDGTIVDGALLKATGLVKGNPDGIKCLGNGELEKQLTVRLDAFSKSAKEKIEASKGTAEVASGQ